MKPAARIAAAGLPATHGVKYRPDIDGLRAIAVVPVVLFHAGVPFFSGGYVGVDVFFVISGFLITGVIAGEIEAGTFRLWTFYERRARRILPALFFMLLVCWAVAAVIFLPKEFASLSKATISTVAFVSNFNFMSDKVGYFDTSQTPSPLLHTWSLAVEEQFYLGFPLLLLALKRWPARSVALVIAGITVGSLVLSAVGVFAWPKPTFYMLPTRAWELGIGSLLALGAVPHVAAARTRELLAAAGLAAILLGVFLYDRATPFPGLAALLPVLGTAAVIQAGASGSSVTTKFLSLRPIVGIGLVSYSLYLWHWPILFLLRWLFGEGPLSWPMMAFAIGAAFVLAVLSWRFVERPFRDKRRTTQRTIFALSAVTAGALTTLCIVAIAGDGLAWRLPSNLRPFAEAQREINPWQKRCNNIEHDKLCVIGSDARIAPTILLWGDSHAAALIPAIDAAARQTGQSVLVATHIACPPLLDVEPAGNHKCRLFNDAVLNLLPKHHKIDTVILAARWALWQSSTLLPGEAGKREFLTQSPSETPSAANSDAAFRHGLGQTIAQLNADGREVVIVTSAPEIGWNVPERLYKMHRFGVDVPGGPSLSGYRSRNAGADAAFASARAGRRVRIIDLGAFLCTPDCTLEYQGAPAYFDDDHLSGAVAASLVGPYLAKTVFEGRPTAAR